MNKTNYFGSKRWDAGIGNRLDAAIGDGVEPSGGAAEALLVPVANVALAYYDRRIRAFFARAGVDIGDGPLTVESIRDKVQAASGFELDSLTPEGLMQSVDKRLASELSNQLGFVVTGVFDTDGLKEQIKAHLLARLVDGSGGGVIHGQTLHSLRVAATWVRAGRSLDTRRAILNRFYQRKYRRSHSQTWAGG